MDVAIKRALTISLSVILVVTLVIAMQPTSTVKAASKKVKITWDANGGKIGKDKKKVISYNKGSKIKKLQTAKKTGHTFKGWYTKKSSGTKITNKTKAKKNTTYFAKWTVNQYMLSYDANGGTVTPASKKITYNKAYGTLPVPTRPGYNFQGWFTKAVGGTKVDATTKMPAGNMTIFAQWKRATVNTTPEEYEPGDYIPWNNYGLPGIPEGGNAFGRQTPDGILIIEYWNLSDPSNYINNILDGNPSTPQIPGWMEQNGWKRYHGITPQKVDEITMKYGYCYSNLYEYTKGTNYCITLEHEDAVDHFIILIIIKDYHRFLLEM